MKTAIAILVVVAAWVASIGLASAQEEGGLVGLHDLKREGSSVCMVGHWHSGSGEGKTKKLAEQAAIRSWADFTGWEYGNHWSDFRRAANKGRDCQKQVGGWYCMVEARPCKRHRRVARRRRR